MSRSIRSIFIAAAMVVGAASAHAGPVTAYSNDFDGAEVLGAGVTGGFSGAGSIVSSQGYGTNATTAAAGFSGNFLRNSASAGVSTVLTLSGLGAHTSIDLDFLLAVIDSWDGNSTGGVAPDLFNVVVDGVSIFSETYDQFDLSDQTAPTSNLIVGPSVPLGFSSSWGESAYDMGQLGAFTGIAHTASTLTVQFFASGSGWQAGADESWAIENVSVTLNDAAAVPAPAPLVLLGLSLLGVAGARRLRRPTSAPC